MIFGGLRGEPVDREGGRDGESTVRARGIGLNWASVRGRAEARRGSGEPLGSGRRVAPEGSRCERGV